MKLSFTDLVFVVGIAISLLLFSAILKIFTWDAVTAIASVVSGATASLSLYFILLQFRSQSNLSRAQFINALTKDIDWHTKSESNLNREGIWYNLCKLNSGSIALLEKYLTFFERIKLLLDTKVLGIEIIDELFAYRFFHLVHNPNVQRQILYDLDKEDFYHTIFTLHALWLHYRQSKGYNVPRQEYVLQCRPRSNANYE
jgi:hypothetical protein